MSNKSKILGLNTNFEYLSYDGFTEDKFRTALSLLDYDAVVINASDLAGCYNSDILLSRHVNKVILTQADSLQIKEDFARIRVQLIDLLKQGKNIFVLMDKNESCCLQTGQSTVKGSGRNSEKSVVVDEFDVYSFLPVSFNVLFLNGIEMDFCCTEPYLRFFKMIKNLIYYAVCFSVPEGGDTLAKIKGSEKTISAVMEYEQGRIILLPAFFSQDYTSEKIRQKEGKQFLDSLFELDRSLSYNGEYELPSWTESFTILNETDAVSKIERTKERLEKTQEELSKQEKKLTDLQYYKRLLTGSGTVLEEAVKQVLSEIGFKILETEKGRDDVIAKYGETDIVAEIKGVTKSAAEKHAAQLEKWASSFHEKTDRMPKALLIVNGFCDTPLDERNEDVFPAQMLPYATARNHILMSSVKLLCLFIEIKGNPSCKEERIQELLSTVGVYKRYEDPFKFIQKKEDI